MATVGLDRRVSKPIPSLTARAQPPRPPFTLCVGVPVTAPTCCRREASTRCGSAVRKVLLLIEEAGAGLAASADGAFADGPTALRFVSAIADGADQIAAEVALELGWELQAVLPFDRVRYRATLGNDGARERFDSLLAKAACVLELPGDSKRELDAYVMTGRATVAHCDVLIAIWDGLPPRGRGGTGEVAMLAITRGTALIHLPPDPACQARLLWSAFDPTVLTVADDPSVERPLGRADVEALLTGLLMPPPDPQERGFLKRFFSERLRRDPDADRISAVADGGRSAPVSTWRPDRETLRAANP